MRILIAEDDPISRRVLSATLRKNGYDVIETCDGEQALDALRAPDAPRLAVLDWMMPGIDGAEVCRRVRADDTMPYAYLLLLTARGEKDDIVGGLDAGADDYLTKPFDPHELRSRLSVGRRMLDLEGALRNKVAELEEAIAHVKTLQGLLPICMHCKSIRDDSATWHRLETYIANNTQANFTHSLCQSCLHEHYPQFAKSRSTDE